MLDLLVVLAAFAWFVIQFLQWKSQEHKKVSDLLPPSPSAQNQFKSRQSRRFQYSRLFALHRSNSTLSEPLTPSFTAFTDRFSNISQLQAAMRKAGLDKCQLIVGVDFTASNEWQGRLTFNRHCLHALLVRGMNPYQRVLQALGSALEPFSQSGEIYAFGFGDSKSRDRQVFPFRDDGCACRCFREVLSCYDELAKRVHLAGPTSFAPLIYKAVEIVKQQHSYHVLLIVSDGQLPNDAETADALIDASHFPLSIVLVGVGDGPWHRMEEFDDMLPLRAFDNFQFVDYNKAVTPGGRKQQLSLLALHALMEVPDQYVAIRNLGYL